MSTFNPVQTPPNYYYSILEPYPGYIKTQDLLICSICREDLTTTSFWKSFQPPPHGHRITTREPLGKNDLGVTHLGHLGCWEKLADFSKNELKKVHVSKTFCPECRTPVEVKLRISTVLKNHFSTIAAMAVGSAVGLCLKAEGRTIESAIMVIAGSIIGSMTGIILKRFWPLKRIFATSTAIAGTTLATALMGLSKDTVATTAVITSIAAIAAEIIPSLIKIYQSINVQAEDDRDLVEPSIRENMLHTNEQLEETEISSIVNQATLIMTTQKVVTEEKALKSTGIAAYAAAATGGAILGAAIMGANSSTIALIAGVRSIQPGIAFIPVATGLMIEKSIHDWLLTTIAASIGFYSAITATIFTLKKINYYAAYIILDRRHR